MEFMILAAAGHVVPVVAPWITYLFTGLLVAMVLCLALEEKIHAQKSVIVGVTAVIALLLGAFTGILPFGALFVELFLILSSVWSEEVRREQTKLPS